MGGGTVTEVSSCGVKGRWREKSGNRIIFMHRGDDYIQGPSLKGLLKGTKGRLLRCWLPREVKCMMSTLL